MRLVNAITARTDAEWPQDHPMRRHVTVLTNEQVAKIGDFLVCSLAGEERIPPPADDADVAATCRCGAALVHRASAPGNLVPICPSCWEKI